MGKKSQHKKQAVVSVKTLQNLGCFRRLPSAGKYRLISDKHIQIILMSPKDALNFGTDHSVFIYLYNFFSTVQFH